MGDRVAGFPERPVNAGVFYVSVIHHGGYHDLFVCP